MALYFFESRQLLFALPGGTEWVLILVVILLFFGGKKIPDLMRGLGRSVREFNEAKDGGKKEKKEVEERKKSEEAKESATEDAR